MTRLFLTLALLLALPAQATINAASFQRTVLNSWDGSRYSKYPDGDFPQNPGELLYFNAFDGNPTNTANAYDNIGIIGDQSDYMMDPPVIRAGGGYGPDIFVVDDPDDANNKVLKTVMQTGTAGINPEGALPADQKHRAQISWATQLTNDAFGPGEDASNSHKTNGGDAFRFIPDVEYWYSFKYRLDCTGTYANTHFFFSSNMSNTVGESTTYIKPGCTGMDVSAERYRIGTVWGGGTDVQTDRVANANVGATGAWHCFIAHLIRKPYSVGSPTAYNPNHLDNTNGAERAGIYEIWVDGVKLKGSAAATADAPNGILGPMYTGADREGRTKIVNGATVSEYNPRFRTGIYWGENNYEGGTITLYQDNIKLMSGEDLYNTVNCQ